jgi:hypothetical protein
MHVEIVALAADELVSAPPGAERTTYTHATPITFSALLTSADLVLDDNVAHDADGNPTRLPVDGDRDATGTVTPEAVVSNDGKVLALASRYLVLMYKVAICHPRT